MDAVILTELVTDTPVIVFVLPVELLTVADVAPLLQVTVPPPVLPDTVAVVVLPQATLEQVTDGLIVAFLMVTVKLFGDD